MAEKENPNLNITPEMIQNLANILRNSNNNQNSNIQSDNTNSNNSTNNIPNLENIKNDPTAIFNNLLGNKSTSSSSNLDIESILKMKSIIEKINNKDNPRNKLLYSLKPYLRESRQKKLDQYINLLSISEITNIFKKEKGDES